MTERIGPYELVGELGRGAMAVVWRAFDTRLEREVALKEPKIDDSLDPATREELTQRFVREGKAAGALNHPGIVTIYHAEVVDGRPLIAMELIGGETLGELLARGALPPAAAIGIADQLLDALAYAHARGVVHRDIKPDNVFVTEDGRVKLTDFGIAHVGTSTTLTQAGTVMGTPGYMAPEQVRGEAVDARADLFAVGVMLHEMLTGANPFTAGDAHPTTVMYRVLNEALPDIRDTLPDAPESLAATVAVAAAKDASQRFSSAEAMRAAVRGEAAVAMPDGESRGAVPGRGGWKATAVVLWALAGLFALGALMVWMDPGDTSGGSPVSDPTGDAAGVEAAAVEAEPNPEEESAAAVGVVEDYIRAVNEGRLADAYNMRSSGFQTMNSQEGFETQNSADNWYAGGWSLEIGELEGVYSGGDVAFVTGAVLGYENRDVWDLSTHVSGFNFELKKESGQWRVVAVNTTDG